MVRLTGQDPAVERANGVLTVHLGPDQIVANLSVEFADALSAPEIERAVERLETRVMDAYPQVTALFVRPQRAETYHRRRRRIEAGRDSAAAAGR